MKPTVLTMLPGVLRDGAVLVLGAVVGGAGVDAAPEKRPAAVAGDGAVVDVVIGHIPADLTGHFPNELGAFSFHFPFAFAGPDLFVDAGAFTVRDLSLIHI